MTSSEVPYTFKKKEEYEAKVNSVLESKKKEYEARVLDNSKYAEETTQKLLNHYYAYERSIAEKKAEAVKNNELYVPAEPEFMVVVKIRCSFKAPPKQRKVLELLRLKKINQSVFVKNNKSIRKMLQLVKDYVAFGYISYELLRKMIYTNGACKVDNKHAKLTNENIEHAFEGKLKCTEELVHHIYFGTEYFKYVSNFLLPIRLNSPLGGYKGRKAKGFTEGGSTGNHYDLIGELVSRMI